MSSDDVLIRSIKNLHLCNIIGTVMLACNFRTEQYLTFDKETVKSCNFFQNSYNRTIC